mgnify:CR=1 FL=1
MKPFIIKLRKWESRSDTYGNIRYHRLADLARDDIIIWQEPNEGWFIEDAHITCIPTYTNTPELLMFKIDLALLDNNENDIEIIYILEEPFIFPDNL